MGEPYNYLRDGAAIYERSFAIIRSEAELARFADDEAAIAVRMIHACGLVEAASDIAFAPDFVAAACTPLANGAPILCDADMVAHGIIRLFLPAEYEVVCALNDARVPVLAQRLVTTRSAAALELWTDRLAGALVAIGNAPTALFHLLNMLEEGDCPRPAAIIGCPVGFVGAAEAKAALLAAPPAPSLSLEGRIGGSAIAVAAVNALASRSE